ncbi:putative late blight resistance protein homolog R1A-10 [Coffea eugenioides]|uniref:putative late blight resistance protein homolog R1A-10 n=1 Tax=Coffea eugenioides TaxID=49369 RepID=UPI000F60B121|nr:putative late blight resistance protein homolog R1A-10 [Coffea eugenioides]
MPHYYPLRTLPPYEASPRGGEEALWSCDDGSQAFDELRLKITESVENIKHAYRQVRLACFGVLQSGSSSLIVSTQTNRSLKHHLKILYEGLQFLSSILQKQQEKYDGLPRRTQDLIGAVVEDAAIVIFSLYQKKIREASAKETDVKLFCLLYKIKLIKAEVEEQHPVDLRFNFPTTSELGFIDLHLQKLKELASSKVDPLAFARDGAGFLKTYLKKTEEDSRRSLKQEVPKGLRLPWLNEMEQHDLQHKLQLQRLKKDISFLRSFLKNYLEQHSRKDNLNLQTMQDGLLFLRSWLENHGEQCNQHKELQALWSRVIEVAYETEFVFDSLIVGDISFYSLLLFDKITQKVKLLKGEALKIHDKNYVFKSLTAITSCLNCSPTTRSKWSGSNKELSTDSATQIEAVVGLNEVEVIINQLKGGSMQLDMLSIVGMPGIGKTTLAQKVYHDPSVTSHFHVRAWCCISQTYNKRDLLSEILACIDQKAQFSEMKEDDDLADIIRKNLKGKKYLIFLDDVWDIEAWHTLKISFPDDANGSRILLTSRDHEITGNRHVVQLLTDDESWELLQTNVANAREEVYPPELNVLGRKIARNCKGLPLSIVIISGILATLDQAGWVEVLNSLSSNIVCDTDQCKSILELSYIHLPDHLKPCLLYFGAFREDQAIPTQRLKWLWIAEGFVQKNESKSPEEIAEGYITSLIKRSLVTVGKQRSLGGVKTCHIHDLLHVFCKGKAKDINFLQVSKEAFDGPHHLRRLSYGSDLKGHCLLPKSLWNMQKLRHLHVHGAFIDIRLANDSLDSSSTLYDLATFSTPKFYLGQSMVQMMRKFPNVRELKCRLLESEESIGESNAIAEMGFLTQLESLKLTLGNVTAHHIEFRLPLNLKQLTLEYFPWNMISTIKEIHNLEVLKILQPADGVEEWDMEDMEEEEIFPKLKFLKLESLQTVRWRGSGHHFPSLEKLVLERCKELKELPSCLWETLTLQLIEVHGCLRSTGGFVRDIKEQQVDYGNEDLKILISGEIDLK